jgi:hypothetical protein
MPRVTMTLNGCEAQRVGMHANTGCTPLHAPEISNCGSVNTAIFRSQHSSKANARHGEPRHVRQLRVKRHTTQNQYYYRRVSAYDVRVFWAAIYWVDFPILAVIVHLITIMMLTPSRQLTKISACFDCVV